MTTGDFVVTIEVAMRGFKYKEHKGIVKVKSRVDQRVGLSSTVFIIVGVRSTSLWNKKPRSLKFSHGVPRPP